jgi:hypothetical protein
MPKNMQLLILGDKIFIDQKCTQSEIEKKHKYYYFCILRKKKRRKDFFVISKWDTIGSYLWLVGDPNVCPPIAIVHRDSYYVVNKIHAIHIWVFVLLILGVIIH